MLECKENVRDHGSCLEDSKIHPEFLQQLPLESLDVNVKLSQCKHPTFLVLHIGNQLLAQQEPLCTCVLVW